MRVGHPCRPRPDQPGVVSCLDADESVLIVACDVCGTIEERAAAA